MKYVILFCVFMFIALIISRAIVQYNFDDEMVQRYDETTVSVKIKLNWPYVLFIS